MENYRPIKQSFFKSTVLKRTVKIVLVVIITASLLLNLFTFIMPVVKYYGTSMSPTLKDGQILIVNKMVEVESGDIIAFYYNNKIIAALQWIADFRKSESLQRTGLSER